MAPQSKIPFFPPRDLRSRALVVALVLLGGCAANQVATRRVLPAPPAALAQSVPVGRGPGAVAVDSRTARVFVANHDDASLSVLDSRSGALVRTVALGQHPISLAVDEAAGRVFTLNSAFADAVVPARAAAATASVSVLDARSGALLRRMRVRAVPLLADAARGRVLVGGAAGLRVLDARRGQWAGPWILARRAQHLAWPQGTAVDAATGRLAVLTRAPAERQQGRLYLLDGRSGRVRRSVSAGNDPVALAVDGRTQHAFVVNQAPADAPGAAERGHRLLAWARRWLPWLPLPWPPRGHTTGSVRIVELEPRAAG